MQQRGSVQDQSCHGERLYEGVEVEEKGREAVRYVAVQAERCCSGA